MSSSYEKARKMASQRIQFHTGAKRAEQARIRINNEVRAGRTPGAASPDYGQSFVGASIGGPLLAYKLGTQWRKEKGSDVIITVPTANKPVLVNGEYYINGKPVAKPVASKPVVIISQPKIVTIAPRTPTTAPTSIPRTVVIRKITKS